MLYINKEMYTFTESQLGNCSKRRESVSVSCTPFNLNKSKLCMQFIDTRCDPELLRYLGQSVIKCKTRQREIFKRGSCGGKA